MGLFDIFRRKKDNAPEGPEKPRIDYLLELKHELLEKPNTAYGGVNFLQLVERQLIEGRLDLATWNIASQVKDCFELANLYWGQGDLARAESYLRQTLERDQRLLRACAEYDLPVEAYHGIEYAKCAACLLGEADAFPRPGTFEPGYEPALINMLIDPCLDTHDFDMGAWQAAEEAWTRKRHPKYRLEEFSVYVKALTGGYGSTEAMLSAHAKMFVGRAKRNPASSLTDGYDDNELIIDHIFAAILKRIGWEGTYRHSWPNTDVFGSAPRTTRHPDRYLGIVSAAQPEPDSDTGIIADEQAARRFIDLHLRDQKDEEGEPLDAARLAKEHGKVSKALTELGWTGDPAALDLMRAYRMDHVLNDSTPLCLGDPVNRASIRLGDWTKLMSDEFDLHPDFIAIAGSEDRIHYMDPQGAWYVYWKQDKRIYAVDRDEWDRPEVATNGARLGLNLWPSYTSFVAWWVSQHLQSQS
jgi:hypothetical protein